jgi:hypothetical protein
MIVGSASQSKACKRAVCGLSNEPRLSHTHTHTHTHTRTHTRTHTHTHTHVQARTHTHARTRTHAYESVPGLAEENLQHFGSANKAGKRLVHLHHERLPILSFYIIFFFDSVGKQAHVSLGMYVHTAWAWQTMRTPSCASVALGGKSCRTFASLDLPLRLRGVRAKKGRVRSSQECHEQSESPNEHWAPFLCRSRPHRPLRLPAIL